MAWNGFGSLLLAVVAVSTQAAIPDEVDVVVADDPADPLVRAMFDPATRADAAWKMPEHLLGIGLGYQLAEALDKPPPAAPAYENDDRCGLFRVYNEIAVGVCAELPKRPWGDYFEQFCALKRFTFGITDGGPESTEEKMHIAFDELKPNFPNFTGCFLDDFFSNKDLNKPYEQLVSIADRVHEHDLRLSVVLYAADDGFKDENRPSCQICDEVSLWFWRQKNIVQLFDDVKRCRDYVGEGKDILLGLYMWEFADKGMPMSAAMMEKQLDFARRLLDDRTISGLIFHPTFVANLDLEAVKISKAWIKANADDPWGV